MTNETVVYVSEQAKQILSTLSDKIGIAASTIWPILIKQQIICGWQYIIVSTLLIIISTILVLIVINEIKKDMDADILVIIIIPAILLCVSIPLMLSGFDHIINPEYYVINDIINAIKSK